MKVLIDARSLILPPHGIRTYLSGLISHLPLANKDRFCILGPRDVVKGMLRNGGCEIEIIDNAVKPYSLVEQVAIPYSISGLNFDVFHVPTFAVPVLVPAPLVVTIHDLTHLKVRGVKNLKLSIYYNFIVKMAVKRARIVLTDSSSSKQDILNWSGVRNEKVHVIPCGVDGDYSGNIGNQMIEETLKAYGINRPFLLFVGTDKPHKNLDRVLRAFKILKAKLKSEHLLVIVGDLSSAFREKHRLRQREGVDGILWTGIVSAQDLKVLYTAANTLVFVSLWEGFGLPMLEAMACSTPVLASKIGPLEELAKDATLFVDPKDEYEIVRGMELCLTDGVLRGRLIEAGRALVRKYTWGKMAEQTVEMYRYALEG